MELVFTAEKETKNTIRFKEAADEGEAKIGIIYIPKGTLSEIAYADGKKIVLNIKAE